MKNDEFIIPKFWFEDDIHTFDIVISYQFYTENSIHPKSEPELLANNFNEDIKWKNETSVEYHIINVLWEDKLLNSKETEIYPLLEYHFSRFTGKKKFFLIWLRKYTDPAHYDDPMNLRLIRYDNTNFIANWIEEKGENMSANSSYMNDSPLLPWNGSKNTLAHLFYQLQNEVKNDKGEVMIPAQKIDLARFLKRNFEVFHDTEIDTIRGYFDKYRNKPKKEKNKLNLKTNKKGFIEINKGES